MSAHRIAVALVCSQCGQSTAAEEVELTTPLGPIDYPVTFYVGDHDESFAWETIRTYYPVLREPADGEPIEVLETFWCATCGRLRWVALTFADETLIAARAVPLDRPTVAAAHAISEEIGPEFGELTGQSLGPLHGGSTGFTERLLAVLPAGAA